MNRTLRTSIVATVLLLVATASFASWYDDYDAGLTAARKGQWSVVVDKMTRAISGNANENNKARTYGAIFINYHPYYYRGIANMNLGRYEQAISDLERTSGAGELDLGRVEDMIQRAKSKLADNNTPAPTPEPVTPRPPVTQPSTPTPSQPVPAAPAIDGALRQRAQSAIGNATQRLNAAQQRRATSSPQYQQAMTALADARTRVAGARSNDDLEQAIAVAENAALYADSATAAVASVTPSPSTPAPVVPRPSAAADAVLSDYRVALRRALESYFAGDFETATRQFGDLTRKMPNSGWVWAFYGASQYSLGAFELNDQYKKDAMASFRKAKQYRKWNGGLPEKYFSKRIRRVFESAG
jgi:tetratricopeptide (TPR) repeat protein